MPLKQLVRPLLPKAVLYQNYLLKRLGPSHYLKYRRLIRLARRSVHSRAVANGRLWTVPGVGVLTLGNHTTHSLQAHWINSGQGIRELHGFARLARGKRCFLDVGAAEGIFSLAFCAITGGEAFSFEPSPAMLERLRTNAALNPTLQVRITPEAVGRGDTVMETRLLPDGQFAATSAAADGRSAGLGHTVRVRSLDTWCRGAQISPDLVKVDVEGFEYDVLCGAQMTLAAHRPDVLLEVHAELLMSLGRSVQELDRFIRDLGYDVFSVDGDPVRSVTDFCRSYRDEVAGTWHVVLRHDS